jgi:hypothetical protein
MLLVVAAEKMITVVGTHSRTFSVLYYGACFKQGFSRDFLHDRVPEEEMRDILPRQFLKLFCVITLYRV